MAMPYGCGGVVGKERYRNSPAMSRTMMAIAMTPYIKEKLDFRMLRLMIVCIEGLL